VLRVLLVDRLRTFADVLARSLSDMDDLQVEVIVPTSSDDLPVLSPGRTDVAVVCTDIARQLARALGSSGRWSASPYVVILADRADADHATELFRHGASGWVERGASIAELTDTIRSVHGGETCIPPRLLTRVMAELADRQGRTDDRRERLGRLTGREEQIMRMIARGMNRREIAAQLHLSPNTVRTHIQSILNRLEVHSTLAAVAVLRSTIGPPVGDAYGDLPPALDVDVDTSIARCAPPSPQGSLGPDIAIPIRGTHGLRELR
jgi:DNA-binding NarL/FixJ family response regulator